jgi:hypothetical protein
MFPALEQSLRLTQHGDDLFKRINRKSCISGKADKYDSAK